jgi:hypothetical protein
MKEESTAGALIAASVIMIALLLALTLASG